MSKPYHIIMSNGDRHQLRADSASEAIYKALDRNRGLTVAECYSGNVDMSGKYSGQINYEVPKHRPLPEKEPVHEKQTHLT